MQNLNKYNQVLDSGGTVKMPGESDPDFGRMVTEYLRPFRCYHIKKTHKHELYKWSAQNLGEKYKDWFIYEGGAQDNVWVMNIRVPKRAMLFELYWTELIVKTIDRSS